MVVKGNLAESRDGYKINIREIINPREEHEEENTRRKKSAAKTTLYLKWMNATKKKIRQSGGFASAVRRVDSRKNKD